MKYFCPDNGGSWILRNVSDYIKVYTKSHFGSMWACYCLPSKHYVFRYIDVRIDIFFVPRQPPVGLDLLNFEVSRSCSVRHPTRSRSPLEKWSARLRGTCLTTHTTFAREKHHAHSGIRTRYPIKEAAADPLKKYRFRRRGCYQLNTRQTQETNVHSVSGIRTNDSSNHIARDLSLRRHLHRDQL